MRPSSLTSTATPMSTSTSSWSSGSGFLLNGAQPETIVLTPFRGPCVIVMPAGAFHRIVQVDDGDVSPSILIYADRRAVVDRYEVIMARTSVATLVDAPATAVRS